MAIKILPDEVASQIAAGEVVERPASVVKELIENAIDAGATEISLKIEEAGKKRIEVIDNGTGIPPDELELAVSRHATSKLSTAEELFHVSTLGFRGEALASIASVSQFTLTSRSLAEDLGAAISVEGGEITSNRRLGFPQGTAVQVRNLFYNVPARKKFLKTDRTEWRHIHKLVNLYAFAYPEIRFILDHNQAPSFRSSGSGDLREVLAAVYGVEKAEKLIAVIAEEPPLEIRGFISPPGLTRSNRQEISFFVNRRPVQDAALLKALTQGYHTMLMKGRYPLAAIFIKMPPESVDVNVHPAKAEVRFEDRKTVFRGVEKAVRRALLAQTPVPLEGRGRASLSWLGAAPDHRQVRRGDPRGYSPETDPFTRETRTEGSAVLTSPIFRLIGQAATTFLIAEGPDGIYLVDQHAAHERVLFEKYLKQHQQSRMDSQRLLEPAVIQFTPSAADLIEEQASILKKLGFELESFGNAMVKIRAIPAILGEISPDAAIRAAVEDLEVDETPLEKNLEEKIIARVCKKAAVKAGQVLSPAEQKKLLLDLEACESPQTCPHGRPTMIRFSIDFLEKRFGRTGKIPD